MTDTSIQQLWVNFCEKHVASNIEPDRLLDAKLIFYMSARLVVDALVQSPSIIRESEAPILTPRQSTMASEMMKRAEAMTKDINQFYDVEFDEWRKLFK